jgi:hypothetical protein
VTKEQRKEDVRRRRLILVHAMGAKCEECGCDDIGRLEFHHKKKRTWIASEHCDTVRQRLYEIDWERGVLGLLCSRCNKTGLPPADPDDVPF